MNLLDTIDDILEQEDNILPVREKEVDIPDVDEEIFNRMADLIINLDPDKLSLGEIETVLEFIESIESDIDEIEELRKPRLAKRSTAAKNQYGKKWYRKNRTHVKRRKAKLRRSSEGRKRENKRNRLSRQGKTPTGRKKVRYHVRKRSQRSDRDENLNR
jgi:hypothetical protein